MIQQQSIAITGQHGRDRFGKRLGQHRRAAQVPLLFVRLAERQVARARATMLDFAGGSQAKTFLCAFVRLLFGHDHHPGVYRAAGGATATPCRGHTCESFLVEWELIRIADDDRLKKGSGGGKNRSTWRRSILRRGEAWFHAPPRLPARAETGKLLGFLRRPASIQANVA